MVIEINGEGKQKFKSFYSCELKVNIIEAFGELKVTNKNTNQALPCVYVKVFAWDSSKNKEFFFRDGYTDIRGKFEYAKTSGDKLKNASKFSILITSDDFGSEIKECGIPKGAHDAAAETKMQAQRMKRLEVRNVYAISKQKKRK
eukprot:CAMPEP_0176341388 /NCGR_PEP_ID=MMETSP0126-20121128/2339_1 /TAXON_ID=141414 ORGANISM="Strombidinopsis acuminatum, Strain SPMC142" /NCGR_SAMPLE_ID=MMETSP0126 /ASSEMBLY_ACC=CAM_ASM_000229 /LENGTH=144 /DNA_ID=CAMNT_0017686177 /DNA_START=3188 /DNA_END=3622 /DNA_ORIENTATION=-